MSNYIINDSTLINIADAIREKTSTTDLYTPENMPAAIAGISGGGGGSFPTYGYNWDNIVTIMLNDNLNRWNNIGNTSASSANRYTNVLPYCGDLVQNLTDSTMPHNSYYKFGAFVCGNNVTNMYMGYRMCNTQNGISVPPACGPNVVNFVYAYASSNVTGEPVCGPKVTNMAYAYDYTKVSGNPVCGPLVKSMAYTYNYCNLLTGSPVCGDNVQNMYYTYYGCNRLTGSPVCGNNVLGMYYTYYNCTNLTGTPVCGPNVISFASAYYNCINLTGSQNEPVIIGPKVTSMTNSFENCYNLRSDVYISNMVQNLAGCFLNCVNIGNIYIASNRITINNFIRNVANLCNRNASLSPQRVNIVCEDPQTFKMLIYNWSGAFGGSYYGSDTGIPSDVSFINIGDVSYPVTKYSYGSAANVYLYF